MERSGQTFKHAFFGKVGKGGVERAEFLEIFKNRFGKVINNFFVNIGGSDEGCFHADSGDFTFTCVGCFRILRHVDTVHGIVRSDVEKGFDFRNRDDTRLSHARSRFFDVSVRMSDSIEEAVNTSVLEHAGSIGGFQAFRFEIFFIVDAEGVENINGVLAVSGTGVADIDCFSFYLMNSFRNRSDTP